MPKAAEPKAAEPKAQPKAKGAKADAEPGAIKAGKDLKLKSSWLKNELDSRNLAGECKQTVSAGQCCALTVFFSLGTWQMSEWCSWRQIARSKRVRRAKQARKLPAQSLPRPLQTRLPTSHAAARNPLQNHKRAHKPPKLKQLCRTTSTASSAQGRVGCSLGSL